MTDRELRRNLQALDADLGRVDLPAGSLARLRSRLERPRRRRWIVPVTAAATAAIALAAVVVVLRGRPDPRRSIAGFSAGRGVELTERPDHDVEVVRGAGEVDVVARGARMTVGPGTRFRREAGQVRVIAGRVGFTVDRRAPGGRPFVVRVSHGAITVVGTEFSVAQTASGGTVELRHGSIRFEADDGREITLGPGESLDWPLPPPATAPVPPAGPDPAPAPVPPPPPATKPAAPPPRVPPGPPDPRPAEPTLALPEAEMTLALQEIDALRIRQQFPTLVARITQVLPRVRDPAARESLHYELCDVLVYRMREPAQACACLVDHRREFGSGRHGAAIDRAAHELRCGGSP